MADGERIGRKRVERLMRQAGLSGLVARTRARTTIRVPGVRVCEDLVDRAFLASAPNRLWVADIERHEALLDRAGVGDLRGPPVAAGG
jgi:putative transposase